MEARKNTTCKNSVPVVVSSLKKGRVGRKAIPVDLEALRSVPLKERMTIEDVCAKLNMSKWKVQKYLRKGLLRRDSSGIKPFFTQANKKSRLKWCVDMIKRGLNGEPRFKDFFLILCSLMKNGSISLKNLKSIICYLMKMIPIVLVTVNVETCLRNRHPSGFRRWSGTGSADAC